jgi:hypothetical protein
MGPLPRDFRVLGLERVGVQIREHPRKSAVSSCLWLSALISFIRVNQWLGFIFPVFSFPNKNGSPGSSCRFPTKERPQSAMEKIIYCTFTFSVSR